MFTSSSSSLFRTRGREKFCEQNPVLHTVKFHEISRMIMTNDAVAKALQRYRRFNPLGRHYREIHQTRALSYSIIVQYRLTGRY